MTYSPVSFRGFGDGLNLRDKEDAVSETEAIDLLNVEFTTRGAVVQRNGYANFTSSALTNAVGSLEPFYTFAGSQQLIAGCGSRIEALNTSGAVVSSATGKTASLIWDFARFGAPAAAEYIYAGNGTDTLQRWDGASWTAPGSSIKAGALAVMAVDQGNRLVGGRFNTSTGGPGGGATNPSTVHFSDAGAPETWSVNNYVHFTPGDGEQVQAVVAWRDLVFIFKQTRFFVVYGTTVAADGSPVFNYRTIEANAGVASTRCAVAAADGVYFMDRRGVYRTTGGDPELVSSNVDPIFLGGASSFYMGGVLNHAQIALCSMWVHEQRIYLAFPSGSGTSNDRVLVYDPRFGWWTLYDFVAACGSSFRIGSQAELVFGYASGSNRVGRHSASYTADVSTAITSRWRSGWFDYDLSVQKTIRETKLWGTGKTFVAVGNDFALETGVLDRVDFTDPSSSTWGGTTWGGSTWATPAGLNPVLRRRAVRGTTFSTYFYNNVLDQPWSVHRATHHLREERIPSMVNA